MKKKIIFIILFIIIVLDTFQALLFNNSSFIAINTKYNNIKVKSGLILNTFYCTSSKLENRLKFDNKNICNTDRESDIFIGKWITNDNQIIIEKDSNGANRIMCDSNCTLNISSKYTYELKSDTVLEKGSYSIDETKIIFKPSNGSFIWYCNIDNSELKCNKYAHIFLKK